MTRSNNASYAAADMNGIDPHAARSTWQIAFQALAAVKSRILDAIRSHMPGKIAARPALSIGKTNQSACLPRRISAASFTRKEFKVKTKSRFCLSLLLIASILISTRNAFAAPSSEAVNFRLQADAGWADSGFVLEAGQQVTITAYGQVITAPIHVFGPGSVSGPDGQLHICPNYDGAPPCAMDHAPYGALVGKIGSDGTPFLIGSNRTFTADSSGSLYLAVNDLLPYYADNYGNYMVFFNH